ncbi:MAG: hypothetical protein HQ553_11200 [Chloroflexi bacterium]|nr:hypothetical protein [Chloroflexota bacterium]
MEVEALRDWIIIVYGAVGVVAICIVLALLIIVYRKIGSILDTAHEAVKNVRNTSSVISESVIQPIAKAQGFITGLRKTMEIFASLTKKEGDEKDGQ